MSRHASGPCRACVCVHVYASRGGGRGHGWDILVYMYIHAKASKSPSVYACMQPRQLASLLPFSHCPPPTRALAVVCASHAPTLAARPKRPA